MCALKMKSFEDDFQKDHMNALIIFSHKRYRSCIQLNKDDIRTQASCGCGLKSVYMTKMVSRQKAQWHFSPKHFCFNSTYYFKTVNNKKFLLYVFIISRVKWRLNFLIFKNKQNIPRCADTILKKNNLIKSG